MLFKWTLSISGWQKRNCQGDISEGAGDGNSKEMGITENLWSGCTRGIIISEHTDYSVHLWLGQIHHTVRQFGAYNFTKQLILKKRNVVQLSK